MYRGFKDEEKPGVYVGEVTVIRSTDKSVLVRLSDNDEEWMPFSQIHSDSDIHSGNCAEDTEGDLVVTQWIAEQKNLGVDD